MLRFIALYPFLIPKEAPAAVDDDFRLASREQDTTPEYTSFLSHITANLALLFASVFGFTLHACFLFLAAAIHASVSVAGSAAFNVYARAAYSSAPS